MAATATRPSSAGPGASAPSVPLHLFGLEDASAAGSDLSTVAGWVKGYLMRPHPELGRTGHVCPFTSQAARLALLRVGVSPVSGDDVDAILRTMQEAMKAFDGLPCSASQRIFRTVIVGFPNCSDAAGIQALRKVQNAMRHHSIVKAKMIGLFEPNSEAEGLLNRDFRPLRAPVPVLAIRTLVEQDAPFVVRNPLLVPVYLAKFPIAGLSRLARIGFPHVKGRLLERIRRAAGRRRQVFRG